MNLTERHCYCLLPEVAQFLVEVLGAFFGKEDSCAFKFHPTLGSRNRLGQPVRPLHIEVDIIGSPNRIHVRSLGTIGDGDACARLC
jgi:hypothetical protein